MTKIEKILIESNAFILSEDRPFVWASGMKSPVYCDNRMTLSNAAGRREISNQLVKLINDKYPTVEEISGVATSGIPYASLVAAEMDLPLTYVRTSTKEHGRGKQIEGMTTTNKNVVLVEDLISTGGSSIVAAQCLRDAGYNVLAVIAIYSYGLDVSVNKFKEANFDFSYLVEFKDMIEYISKESLLDSSKIDGVKEWYKKFNS